jgi:formate dehydrogenase subunit delta
MNSLDKLVYMANQIAKNFSGMSAEKAALATADHVAQFWDPRMRRMIDERFDAGGEGLDPIALAAIQYLHDKGAPPSQTRATEFNAVNEGGHGDAG